MFDFGLDKLLLVGILVGVILGPSRLRELRQTIPRSLGRLHALYLEGRSQVVDELDDLAPDWREYDPRALHPRRILRELADTAARDAAAGGERTSSDPAQGESEGEGDEVPPKTRRESSAVSLHDAPDTAKGTPSEAPSAPPDGETSEAPGGDELVRGARDRDDRLGLGAGDHPTHPDADGDGRERPDDDGTEHSGESDHGTSPS